MSHRLPTALLALLAVVLPLACSDDAPDGTSPSRVPVEVIASDVGSSPTTMGSSSAVMGNSPADAAERQRQVRAEIDYFMQRHSPLDEGFDIVARYAEEGDTTIRAYMPHGRLWLGSSLLRSRGKALFRDPQRRLVVGLFRADTLVSGLRFDAGGIYAGMMDARACASGHGAYLTTGGDYYEGYWAHDQREGFGLSIAPGHLHVGQWQRDRFRGEHTLHHAERIYGIDISRYQHEKGRRRYAIDWKRLRVSHLGRRISAERVLDAVDYPVSFVYIKSTEGTTIENRYFADDYAQARQRSLPVGAYHFFSTQTPPLDQARHFLSHTEFRHGDLPPILDVEPSDRQIADMGGADVLLDAVRQWLQAVERATRCRPLLYVNQRFANLYLSQAPDLKDGYHFWIARYGEYKPDVHLDIWQLSGDGHVTGIVPPVDINVFNGYQVHWDEFLRSSTIP